MHLARLFICGLCWPFFCRAERKNICVRSRITAQMGSFEIKLNSWLETHRSFGKQEERSRKEAERASEGAECCWRGDCRIFQSARRGRKWSESEGRASVNNISNQKEWKSACLECVNTSSDTQRANYLEPFCSRQCLRWNLSQEVVTAAFFLVRILNTLCIINATLTSRFVRQNSCPTQNKFWKWLLGFFDEV